MQLKNFTSKELEEKLAVTTDLVERIDILNELAWKLNGTDTVRSLEIAKKALEQSTQLNYLKGIANSRLVCGYCNLVLMNMEESILDGNKSFTLFNELNDPIGKIQSLNLLGACYFRTGEFEKSVTHLLSSLEKSEQIGYKLGIASASGNLGNIYSGLEEYEKSVGYYQEALKMYIDEDDIVRQASCLSNIGSISYQKNDFKKAIEFFIKSTELSKDKKIESPILINDYTRMGECYFKLGDFSKAKNYISKGLDRNKDNFYIQPYFRAMHILGSMALIENNIDTAFDYFTKALQQKNASLQYTLPELYESFANLYMQKKDPQNALNFYIKFHEAIKKRHESKSDKRLKSIELEHLSKVAEIEKSKNNELQMANEILKKQNLLIEAQKEKMIESITYAQRIQQSVFPDKNEIKKLLPNSFIYYQPKDIVSGDFYWFSHVDHKLIIAAIDCTGHGIPGAFMSLIGNTILNQIVNEKQETSPAKILRLLNIGVSAALKQEKGEISSQDGMDMSLCVIDNINKEIQFAGALNPLYIINDGQIEIIKGNNYSIGGSLIKEESVEQRKFTNHSFPLKKGSCIYLFTDGYFDQFGGEQRKKMGSQRFREILLQYHNLPMEQQREAIIKEFEQWKGQNSQIDDVLVIGIRL